AGSYNFMRIAQQLGYETSFMGPAIPIPAIIDKIKRIKPKIVGLSYRLTPKTVKPLLEKFFQQYRDLKTKPDKLIFAGTPEVVKIAKTCGPFDYYFIGGESKYEIISKLRKNNKYSEDIFQPPMDLISRIEWKKPFPILRAHFGLPNLIDTIEGIQTIAESKVLDVVSIAPDQNTQSHYFHPEDQQQDSKGAGGVPIRSRDDLRRLDEARMRGNYPLLRIYAGTRDFIKLGKLFQKTIRNAWAAIPLFWFNQMDGRGPLSLEESIRQHLHAIKWHAKNNIPVEINDPHHWSLRDSSDAIAVADMYLCGIIAKKLGVKHFIAQYMFNTPPNLSLDMDLAKILAKNELLDTLVDKNFSVIKQVRTGLASFPLDLNKAKGQLAAASMVQLAIKPEIVHVVSYSEADHAAKPKEIIESCKIVSQVIDIGLSSNLSFMDKNIIRRKNQLIKQVQKIINLIPNLSHDSDLSKDPYIDPTVLNNLVKYGIFDAPHLKNNKYAKGEIQTKIINGACYAWDSSRGKIYDEIERIKDIDYICDDLNLFKPFSKTRGFIG
ncbi:MAG: methionine synthase, partial [Candidatus Lokiarchaeota archaeon]